MSSGHALNEMTGKSVKRYNSVDIHNITVKWKEK